MPLRNRMTSTLAIGLLAPVVLAPQRAPASLPGSPGVPQAPLEVVSEDFENNMGTTPLGLASYLGPGGATYTAHPAWLINCNGVIVEASSPDSDLAASGCANITNYSGVRQLAYALGFLEGGPAGRLTDDAVSAYTETDTTPAGVVEFATVNPIPLVATSRFITFSIDAAEANCQANHALFEFYLLDGSTALPVFSAPIDPCTDPRALPITVPPMTGQAGRTVFAGHFAANGSLLFSGSSMGVRMINATGDGIFGNDAAFDDISILDVTPQLDKTFSPTVVGVGQPSTLTLTITNTTELAAKAGWSLTDNLPAGLTIASPASTATTCANGVVSATAGGSSIALNGDLNAGQASCTASVNVTSQVAATYTNGPANVTAVGLNPPRSATVRSAP